MGRHRPGMSRQPELRLRLRSRLRLVILHRIFLFSLPSPSCSSVPCCGTSSFHFLAVLGIHSKLRPREFRGCSHKIMLTQGMVMGGNVVVVIVVEVVAVVVVLVVLLEYTLVEDNASNERTRPRIRVSGRFTPGYRRSIRW